MGVSLELVVCITRVVGWVLRGGGGGGGGMFLAVFECEPLYCSMGFVAVSTGIS